MLWLWGSCLSVCTHCQRCIQGFLFEYCLISPFSTSMPTTLLSRSTYCPCHTLEPNSTDSYCAQRDCSWEWSCVSKGRQQTCVTSPSWSTSPMTSMLRFPVTLLKMHEATANGLLLNGGESELFHSVTCHLFLHCNSAITFSFRLVQCP